MLSAIVLAAGLSNRMGNENKLLLSFQGKTILETTISNILEAGIGEVIVVVGHEAEKVKAVLKNYPLSIIENLDYQKGMTTSIQAGIRSTQNSKPKTHNAGYMICLSDMVLIEPYEYQLLAQQFLLRADEKAIIQPVFKGKRGNPVIFSSFYKNAILETEDTDGTSRDNREGCRSVVQAHKKHVKLVEMPTNHVLQDIDFKEDYERILSIQ